MFITILTKRHLYTFLLIWKIFNKNAFKCGFTRCFIRHFVRLKCFKNFFILTRTTVCDLRCRFAITKSALICRPHENSNLHLMKTVEKSRKHTDLNFDLLVRTRIIIDCRPHVLWWWYGCKIKKKNKLNKCRKKVSSRSVSFWNSVTAVSL